MAGKKKEDPVFTPEGVKKYMDGSKMLTREYRVKYPKEASKIDGNS